MAAPGGVFNTTVVVGARPEDVMSRLVAATAGAPGYSVSTTGSNSLVLVRKYWPTWVIVIAVIGALIFLVGLLALLLRQTETLTVSLSNDAGGTRVDVSGLASPEMTSRIRSVLDSLEKQPTGSRPGPEMVEGSAEDINDPSASTKVCPECAETIKSAANVCRYCGHRFAAPELET